MEVFENKPCYLFLLKARKLTLNAFYTEVATNMTLDLLLVHSTTPTVSAYEWTDHSSGSDLLPLWEGMGWAIFQQAGPVKVGGLYIVQAFKA